MKTKVINFIGAPGVGKSVCASLVFAELKIKGYCTEYVQEYAKTLAWKNDIQSLQNQEFVTSQQYYLLQNIKSKVQYIVTDSPLFLGLYYNKIHNGNDTNLMSITENLILHYINQFDNIYIFLERGDYPYEQYGRIHSLEESFKIQSELLKLLKIHNIEFVTFKSDKNNILKIIDYVTNTNTKFTKN